MSLIVTDNKKVFEKPPSGQYTGVIVDTVDLGIVSTNFGNKMKVRIVWALGTPDGKDYAKDTEGNTFRVMSEVNASMNEKSDLFRLIRGVLGAAPPAGPYDVENLIGRSNLLFVVQEPNKTSDKVYSNVKAILPLPAGATALAIPTGYVRFKDKKDTRTTGQATAPAAVAPFTPAAAPQPSQTIAPAQATAAAVGPAPAQAATPKADVVLDSGF